MPQLDRARLLFSCVLVAIGLGAAASAFAPFQGLPLPTTLNDFRQPGTQPNTLVQAVQASINCTGCHSGYDPDQEPYTRWTTSMMAQAGRDPVFYAALAIANQDAGFAGELCLRCHAPGAWLDGRSTPPDGSALNPGLGDLDGVTCHLCHRMVNPVFEPGESPDIDARILEALAHIPPTPNTGQYIIDPTDIRRGPFDLGPNFFFHDWRQSPFHETAQLCGTCHDLSNPTLSKQPNGSYELNTNDAPHPTQIKTDEFPVERTFSEWANSAYARNPIDTTDPSFTSNTDPSFPPGHRFGGNTPLVGTCQECHQPTTHGTACQPVLGGAVRDDLPLHDFLGVNTWVLEAVRSLYPDIDTGLTNQSVASRQARVLEMQRRAADLFAWPLHTQLAVRIVNQTAHKLPTGYTEGRRMWINVQFFDANNVLIAERGAYDGTTATLTTADTKVYRGEYGLDAQQAAATGVPAGPSFHFVLNNTILSDDRIPPRGFTNAAFAAAQTAPVAYSYMDEQYWDDSQFAIPSNAASATVSLFHQTSSKEYMEFLRDTNTTNGDGLVGYNAWVAQGKDAPVLMQSVHVDFAVPSSVPPIQYGTAKYLANGRQPVLRWLGTPSPTTNDFRIVVKGLPRSQGVLESSPAQASIPFQGGTLLLGGTRTRVATFQFDALGSATIPIPVTPAMVGRSLNYQATFRDSASPQPYGLTNALHVSFTP